MSKEEQLVELKLVLSSQGFNNEQIQKVTKYVKAYMRVDDAICNIAELQSYFSKYDFTPEESATILSYNLGHINYKYLERADKYININGEYFHPIVINTYYLMQEFDCNGKDIVANPDCLYKFNKDEVTARYYLLIKKSCPKEEYSKYLTCPSKEFNAKYQIRGNKYLRLFYDEVIRYKRKLDRIDRDQDNLNRAIISATCPAMGHRIHAQYREHLDSPSVDCTANKVRRRKVHARYTSVES